jgi:hypothetical protein
VLCPELPEFRSNNDVSNVRSHAEKQMKEERSSRLSEILIVVAEVRRVIFVSMAVGGRSSLVRCLVLASLGQSLSSLCQTLVRCLEPNHNSLASSSRQSHARPKMSVDVPIV